MADVAPKASTSASASVFVPPPKEPSFVMPPPSVLLPLPKAMPSMNPAPTTTGVAQPTEIIERPQPKTLARGRYEAKPATIWIVVCLGVLFVLLFVLARLRAARRAKEQRLAALTEAVRRAPTARA